MNIVEFDQGSAGESLASNNLALIFNGETTRETMRGEGLGALDLQLKFATLFPTKTQLQVAVQVKTGQSFARWTPTKNRWRLQNIDPTHLKKWKATNQPVLLIWVRIDPAVKLYWKLIDSKAPTETLSVSENHLLTPASRFEIERLLQKQKKSITQPPSFSVPPLDSTSKVRSWARPKFSKSKGIYTCMLGNVSISNYAWRHLTRITRSQSHIQDSLSTLPYIKQILDLSPHQIQTLPMKIETIGDKLVVYRKVLAIYRNLRFTDKGTCSVYVRLDEKITYSENWREKGLIRQKLYQELKLESIYRKTANSAHPPSSLTCP